MDFYKLMNYAYRKFKLPKSYWTEIHTMKRACELHAVEEVLEECMNRPFEDYIEIMENYVFELEMLKSTSGNSKDAIIRLQYAIEAVYILIDYAKNGGEQ